MPAPDVVRELVKRFEENIDSYRSGRYNETQLRREFLDPLFEALGWDVFNKAGYAEAYKDVIHEDSIDVEGATKAPDYAFRIGGQRKFFLEAKKPSVKVETDIYPAFQLRRYSWSAKLPIGVLSDFEEFAVYETRSKPNKKDKASTGRIAFYKYTDYIEKWDEIAGIFSREAVLKGSFDTFAEGQKKKKGTAEVDDAFLEEIERWRELLAKNFALRNPDLTVRELNYAVQVTIDRIVFLRICEDRGIEPYGRLKEVSLTPTPSPTGRGESSGARQGEGIYAELVQLFQQADERYNSGLFHFPTGRKAKDEKNASSAADSLTLSLNVDDRVLKEILGSLYYPESPYVFSEIPSDILGQVYERFLGKVIRLTAGHQAKVEEKPEVRKAGGVYYTPTYIVEYIVENTVGRLLGSPRPEGAPNGDDKERGGEGKTLTPSPSPTGRGGLTPDDVEKLRILDPACGSGTFAIGAYAYLLDWHRDWYSANDPQKWAKRKNPPIFQGRDGWQLTLEKKKEILLNNIYGVDIDPQAVEVTKLSLLLKLVENPGQLDFMSGRILPDLSQNIKCGNSLIGPDYYNQKQMTMGFDDEEERYRVNAFDWKTEFASIFNRGGFDAVIGNPPYIRIQAMKEYAPTEVEFYKERYKAASKGNYDIYVVFVEKGLSLLNKSGRLGFILPHKFFNSQYGEPIRGFIANGNHLGKIVHFGAQQVFADATTYTCLMFLDKMGSDKFEFEKVQDLNGWRISNTPDVSVVGQVSASRATEKEWNFFVGKGSELVERLSAFTTKLDEVVDIFVGLQTSADDVFVMDFVNEGNDSICLYSKILKQNWFFEKDLVFPLVSGTDVNRYSPLPSRQYILFPYRVKDENPELLDFESISKNQPKTAEYLMQNKKRLEDREHGKFKGHGWHRFGRNQNIGIQDRVKLCVPRLVDRLYAGFDVDGNHYLDNADVGGITLKHAYADQKLIYILGLLNSKLLRWYFPSISAPFRGGWLSANRQFLSQLPIRTINFSDAEDKARHDKLVSLVERMLELTPLLSPQMGGGKGPRTPQDKERVKREIESTDRQIDRLVYELYELTEDEVKMVEGGKDAKEIKAPKR